MSENSPVLVWIRRDLRLADHAALSAAAASGRPVLPVFICDELVDSLGAAPKWRLGLGVECFGQALAQIGSGLILRRGPALAVLQALIAETGATGVYWQRAYDPDGQARDRVVKTALIDAGVTARSFAGHLLFEPWTVQTKTGGFYKVFTPFWKSVQFNDVPAPLPPVTRLTPPELWPEGDQLQDWTLGRTMNRGAAVVARYVRVGEDAALDRLAEFTDTRVADYVQARDLPGVAGTSGLSENLTYGEISPRVVWAAGQRAHHEGAAGAMAFMKELVWREFAYHLLHHTPHILTDNWRREWDGFAWNEDETCPEVLAWKQGRTGVEFVDAGMRELQVTGIMHNRARMIVASYLTKHLLTHWRVGQRWFAEHLVDWDPASNAMGWQWAAGSGPDAAPYFRVFNPATQLDKFDRDRSYIRRWIAEGQAAAPETALQYFQAVPRNWRLSHCMPYPEPVMSLAAGRERALASYTARNF